LSAILALFATIAIIYWVEWRAGGSPGTLLIAALAAGLIPWTKREGLALLAVICLTIIVTKRGTRRAWLGVGAFVLAAALLSGPWWIFVARNAIANPDFLPIHLTTFGTNLSRLPTIVAMALSNLSSIDWSFVWPLAMVFGLIDLVRRRRARSPVWHTDDVLPVTALVYLGLMSLSYVFSAFVPYQQHVASSFFRLAAHVVPLPVLWIACRSIEESSSYQSEVATPR